METSDCSRPLKRADILREPDLNRRAMLLPGTESSTILRARLLREFCRAVLAIKQAGGHCISAQLRHTRRV